jgi:5-methylcytosine-specific restriction endonuclease McrA
MTRNGVCIHVMQCLECGSNVGGIKREGDPPPFDEEIEKSYEDKKQEAREQFEWQMRLERDRENKAEEEAERLRKEQWKLRYHEYLRGEEWQAKRLLVLKRCNEICEGCGTAQATQVHHVYYNEEMGSEPLWALRGVCRPCHEREHGI